MASENKLVEYTIVGHDVVCKVAGVSFEGRQGRIRTMSTGDILTIQPTPHPTHEQAVKVFPKGNPEDMGYLPRLLADIVYANFMENGNPIYVEGSLLEITGGFSVEVNVGMIIGFTMPSGRI